MPPRSREPDLVRMVVSANAAGSDADAADHSLRRTTARLFAWVRRTDKGIRAVAGPDDAILHASVDLSRWRISVPRQSFSIGRDRRVALRPECGIHLMRPKPDMIDADETITSTDQWCESRPAAAPHEGPWRESRRSFTDYAQSAYLCADRRYCGRGHDFTPEQLGGVRTGTTVTVGCVMPRLHYMP